MNKVSGCAPKECQPVANEVMALIAEVTSMARDVAERLDSKLSPIMRSGSPCSETTADGKIREYPPLFSELASHITSIRNSIIIIEDCIRRTEL